MLSEKQSSEGAPAPSPTVVTDVESGISEADGVKECPRDVHGVKVS